MAAISGTAKQPAAGESALVLFSGGQDSTISLGWALNRFARVHTVGFEYGQRHHVEMRCRETVRAALGVMPYSCWPARLGTDHLLGLELFNQIGATAMTSEMDIATDEKGLPNTFVPGRNILFMAAAGALAWKLGARHLVLGVCETDSSGYPDCRDDAIKAMQLALNAGMDARFVLHTPLMWLDKAQSWTLARQEGGDAFVELARTATHTCYLGERGTLHAWGYGCGSCPACQLRAAGWEGFCRGAPLPGVCNALP